MSLHFLNLFANNFFVHALFKTLMHSIWQGIILAVLAAIVLASTKKATTIIRYKLLICLLIGFISTSAITFCYELSSLFSANSSNELITNGNHSLLAPTINYGESFSEKAINFFRVNENILVLIWSLIILFKSIKLLSGLYGIHRLKTKQVFDAGEYWNAELKRLCIKLNINKPVKLLRSAIAEIPMVAGHFKPVILFPAAALMQLPIEQVEAILLHELAHIRRKDYLVNMLQAFTEILFFFNPAVLWVSNLLKDERENCCDDIAIAEVQNKKQFIHALLSFQEYSLAPKCAASLKGRKGLLINRIKRILTNNNETLNTMEKILLAAGILSTCVVVAAFTQKNQSTSIKQDNAAITYQKTNCSNIADTTAPTTIGNDESKMIMSDDIDGKHYKLIELNGKVSELYVDNTKVPDDKIEDYKAVIDKIESSFKLYQSEQAKEMKAQNEKMLAQIDLIKQNQKLINDKTEKELEKQAELMNKQALAMQDKIQQDLKPQQEEMEKQAELMNEKAKEIQDEVEKEIKPQTKEYEEQAEEYAKKAKQLQDQIKKEIQPKQEEYIKQAEQYKQKAIEIQKQIEKALGPQQEIMEKQAELMKEKALEIQKSIQPQTEELKKQSEIFKQKALEIQEEINRQMLQSDSTHV